MMCEDYMAEVNVYDTSFTSALSMIVLSKILLLDNILGL